MGTHKERFKVVPAVYVIFQREGKVLLLKRANTGYMDGLYSLPAGHVDGDEPAVLAAVREAQEEVAVTLTRDSLRLAHVMHRQADPSDRDGSTSASIFTLKLTPGRVNQLTTSLISAANYVGWS